MGSSSTAARPAAARSYVEADRSRVDDYYLAEGTGLAERYVATPHPEDAREYGQDAGRAGGRWTGRPTSGGSPGTTSRPARRRAGCVDDDAGRCGSSRSWSTGRRPGRWPPRCTRRSPPRTTPPRTGPRPRSSAGSPSTPPPGSGRAAGRCRSRSSSSRPRSCGTTPPGPATRTATCTCRSTPACSPPARGEGCTRSASSTASRRSTGSGTPRSCATPSSAGRSPRTGYTLDPETGEIAQLAPYAGAFSARAAQITRNIDRYEAAVAQRAPRRGARPALRRAWDRRAWAQARPDKVVPESGAELRQRWVDELHQLGFTPPTVGVGAPCRRDRQRSTGTRSPTWCSRGWARRRSSWNAADIRGEVERIIAAVDIVAPAPVRHELVEDLTDRTVARCVPLLARDDVPDTSAPSPPTGCSMSKPT